MIALLTEDIVVGLLCATLFVVMCGALWFVAHICFGAFAPRRRRNAELQFPAPTEDQAIRWPDNIKWMPPDDPR